VVSKSSAVTTTDASNKRQQQPDSSSSTSTLATTVIANGNFDIPNALTGNPFVKRFFESTCSQVIGLDDGVATPFQRSRIHKPHAYTQAFKVNRSTSRSLILNFPTTKEPQSQIKNSPIIGRFLDYNAVLCQTRM
ncbi:hypothetical protein Tco_1100276, partial [Tanacetum coccineum]